MRFANYFFFYLVFIIIEVEPDDIAPVCHQRCNIPVAEMEHPFNNFLFGFINGAGFSAFSNQSFDFFFRYGIVFRTFDIKDAEEKHTDFIQQPYYGMSKAGKYIHRCCHCFSNLFCP